jgi:hypothetical protein
VKNEIKVKNEIEIKNKIKYSYKIKDKKDRYEYFKNKLQFSGIWIYFIFYMHHLLLDVFE